RPRIRSRARRQRGSRCSADQVQAGAARWPAGRLDSNGPHNFSIGVLGQNERIMRNVQIKVLFVVLLISVVSAGLSLGQHSGQQNQAGQQKGQPPAQTTPAPVAASADATVNAAIDKVTSRESALTKAMGTYHPLMETYLQTLDKDEQLAFHPTGDKYFI